MATTQQQGDVAGSPNFNETQKIVFRNNNDIMSDCILSADVTIHTTSTETQNALGSSAIAVKSITDYPFIVPGAHGHGLAVHRSQEYIAYAINKASTNPASNIGRVRVMNTSNSKRCLIKDIRGLVMDISFSWTKEDIILAFTDTTGSFYVYKIYDGQDNDLGFGLILAVLNEDTSSIAGDFSSQHHEHSVTWCRYVPENPAEPQETDSVPPLMLAVTAGPLVEVWQMYKLWQAGGAGTQMNSSEGHGARLHSFRFSSSVTSTNISPDSTCVAIATSDGFIRFYQVESNISDATDVPAFAGGESDCVHEWKPHDGQPVSCLHFLDNHIADASDDGGSSAGSFWKFALTGTRNNTELKLWTCKTWTCLQVIRFQFSPQIIATPLTTAQAVMGSNTMQQQQPSASAPPSTNHSPSLRCASLSPSLLLQGSNSTVPVTTKFEGRMQVYLDDTSKYVILTDQARKMMYIIIVDTIASTSSGDESLASNGSDSVDDTDSSATDSNITIKRIVSVSEVPVQFVPICVAINSAKMKRYQRWKHHTQPQQHNNYTDTNGGGVVEGCTMERGLVINCHLLTTKSLLFCCMRLQPKLPPPIVASSATGAASTTTRPNHHLNATAARVASNGGLGVSNNDDNDPLHDTIDDSTVDSIIDIHDGLTDLSLNTSDADLSGSVAGKDITCNTDGNSVSTALASSIDNVTINSATATSAAYSLKQLSSKNTPHEGQLLPPNHFSASVRANESQAALTVATASLPLHPTKVETDAPPDNKANATLSALLKFTPSVPGDVMAARMETAPANPPVINAQLSSDHLAAASDASSCNSSVPPVVSTTIAAAVSSSTSSPSLEIQQILKLSDENSSGASSNSSSNSNSRGPTQLEMAVEHSHLTHQNQQSDEDQLEPWSILKASKNLSPGQQLVTVPRQEPVYSLGGVSALNNLPHPNLHCVPDNASSSDTLQKNIASEENSSTEKIRQQQLILQKMNLQKERSVTNTDAPQQNEEEEEESLVKSEVKKKSVPSPLLQSSPVTCNLLQTLLPGFKLDSGSTDGAAAGSVTGEIIAGSVSSASQSYLTTCEELEAKIKGSSLSSVSSILGSACNNSAVFNDTNSTKGSITNAFNNTTNATSSVDIITAGNTTNSSTANNNSILSQISTTSFFNNCSSSSLLNTTPGYNSAADAGAGAAISHQKTIISVGRDNSSRRSEQQQMPDAAAAIAALTNGTVSGKKFAASQTVNAGASNEFLLNKLMGIELNANKEDLSICTPTAASVSASPLVTTAAAAQSTSDVNTIATAAANTPVVITANAAINDNEVLIDITSVATTITTTTTTTATTAPVRRIDAATATATVATSCIGVQVIPPPQPPPTVVCRHTVNSSNSELKELRSLLLNTQQQIGKLNKKIDELSTSQRSHQSSNSSQVVAASLRPAIEAALRNEIRQAVPHSVTKGLESAVGQQLPHELQRMVTATEARMADNISKMIHSRAFTESLSNAVCSAVAPQVASSCREAYTKLVLPGFNSLTSRVLQQFNDLFHKGTTEYLLQVKSEVSGVLTCIESSKSSAVREMEATKTTIASLLKVQQDLVQQHQQAMQQHASHMLSEAVVRRVVSEEVTRVLNAMHRAAAPGTPSAAFHGAGADKPQSPKQAQLQLEQLISGKQFNSAFKQALSANDLSQVLFVCERVNRESLMASGSNCKLSQEVLMSLINQLSHDLGQKTDLKMKFLEDSLLCIDLNHPVTREHMTSVVGYLTRNVQAYLDTNPPTQTQNRFKMLLLAASHHATNTA